MARLEQSLLKKMSTKLKKPEKYVREQISRKASKDGYSSEAVQIIWATQLGIGAGRFLSKRESHVQEQVRKGLERGGDSAPARSAAKPTGKRAAKRGKLSISQVVTFLIKDQQLRDRCRAGLTASRFHDSVFREATTILDNRLKKLTAITRMLPSALVSKVLHGDPSKAIIQVSNEGYEQQGIHDMCKGVMLAFRDTTHHEIKDNFSQVDALKFCGVVDILLSVIEKGTVHRDRIPGVVPAAAAAAKTV